MAQHDYSIANQGFPATRADINNVLSAIATNNSGTSAPTTQYAGQFWIDTTTTTWTLYIHDGTDDIQFATIDTSANTVNFIDSALASDVVINTSGDITTTGAFTSVGIDDNATSTAITIDSSENVGIGTASPSTKLNVEGTGVIAEFKSTDNNNVLRIKGNNATNGVAIGSSSSDDFVFTTNTTERMRIEDSSGNVGIGTSSPTTTLDVSGTASLGTDQTDFIKAIGGSGTARIDAVGGNTNVNLSFATKGAGITYFWRSGYGGTESMRIDGSGGLRVNSTSNIFNSASNEKLTVDGKTSGHAAAFSTSATGGFPAIYIRNTLSGTVNAVIFHQGSPSSAVGSITMAGGTTTAYNTSSDYRLKENVMDMTGAIDRVKALKPSRFNFISNPDTTVDGFLAHEVSSIVPEAITGEKDETETKEKVVVNANGQVIVENIEQADWEAGKIADEEGNTQYPTDSTWEATKVVPVYQGIDQAKLVPVLTKALQEAVDKIEQLEARITVLENN